MAKIWVVEDDRNLADLTKIALVNNGYEVTVFHDARKAIEEAKKTKPHLILMDITLPEIDGAEAVRILRKDPSLRNIPVIFLTGLISEQDESLEKAGLTIDGVKYRVLGKPYDILHLLLMIQSIIKTNQ